MEKYLRLFSLIFLLTALVLTSCEEDDAVAIPVKQNGLVAVAGEDMTVKVNTEIVFDGSASSDKNNESFTYLWKIKSQPSGSTEVIKFPTTAKPTFTPKVAGVYIIQLVIAQNTRNDTDELILTVQPGETTDPNGPVTMFLTENIDEDLVFADIHADFSTPDYIVKANIEIRADVTFMPGVVIAFEENTGLNIVQGSLSAVGDVLKGIVFKGLDDRRGYWYGVSFETYSTNNQFSYALITGAGGSREGETAGSAIKLFGDDISGSSLKISHTRIEQSAGHGLYLGGRSSLLTFDSNTISNTDLAGVNVPAHQLHVLDIHSDYGNRGIMTSGEITGMESVTWKKLNTPFIVERNIIIKSGVNIEEGVTFKMKKGTSVQVLDNGFLRATGKATSKVIFTAFNTTEYWNGIYINTQHAENIITYTEVAYAGFAKVGDADQAGNISLGNGGLVLLNHSTIREGLGYGIAAKYDYQFNTDIETSNTFENLQKGKVYPVKVVQPDQSVTGVWMDQWSFNKGLSSVNETYYDKASGIWFGGADSPWDIQGGLGIVFKENGEFVWTIGEHSPMTGCESWSAEFITGTASAADGVLDFNQDYWRSKYINSCDPEQNVDMTVEPQHILLTYEILEMYNLFTGEKYYELKFTNPGGTTFSYYRK